MNAFTWTLVALFIACTIGAAVARWLGVLVICVLAAVIAILFGMRASDDTRMLMLALVGYGGPMIIIAIGLGGFAGSLFRRWVTAPERARRQRG